MTGKYIINSLCLVVVSLIIVFSCKTTTNNDQTSVIPKFRYSDYIHYIKPEEGRYVLKFDSVSRENMCGWKINDLPVCDTMFRNFKFHFSDKDKKTYEFYSVKSLSDDDRGEIDSETSYSLNGYSLDTKGEYEKYIDKHFRVEIESAHIAKGKENITIEVLRHLRVLENLKPKKRKVIDVYPKDNLYDILLTAKAYDSIYIHKGVYSMSEDKCYGYRIEHNHISVTGENGVFIYTGREAEVITIVSEDVVLKNLHLSHIDSRSCTRNVIELSDKSRDITIQDCDINGCGVVGVYFQDIDSLSNYRIENNCIHNNSGAPLALEDTDYFKMEDLNFSGISGKNNIIWNNGINKIDEPSEYFHILFFGISPNDKSLIYGQENRDVHVHDINSVVSDTLIQLSFYAKELENEYPDSEEDYLKPLAYINPSKYANKGDTGILIINKPHNFEFFDNTRDAINYLRSTKNFPAEYRVSTYAPGYEIYPYFTTYDKEKIAEYEEEINDYKSSDTHKHLETRKVMLNFNSKPLAFIEVWEMGLLTEMSFYGNFVDYENYGTPEEKMLHYIPNIKFEFNKQGDEIIKTTIDSTVYILKKIPEFHNRYFNCIDTVAKIKGFPLGKNWKAGLEDIPIDQENTSENTEIN